MDGEEEGDLIQSGRHTQRGRCGSTDEIHPFVRESMARVGAWSYANQKLLRFPVFYDERTLFAPAEHFVVLTSFARSCLTRNTSITSHM